MVTQPVIPRALACQDVEVAIDHYLGEDAPAAALGLVDALERAYAHIGRHPATGSPRHAHELNLSNRNRALLTLIAETKPASLHELADRSGRTPGNLSRTLRTMERYGLVRLHRSPRGMVHPYPGRAA